MATSMDRQVKLSPRLLFIYFYIVLSHIAISHCVDEVVFQAGNQQKLNVGAARPKR